MNTIALLYLVVGLVIILWLLIKQGSPGHWSNYPTMLLGWPLVIWYCWRHRHEV